VSLPRLTINTRVVLSISRIDISPIRVVDPVELKAPGRVSAFYIVVPFTQYGRMRFDRRTGVRVAEHGGDWTVSARVLRYCDPATKRMVACGA